MAPARKTLSSRKRRTPVATDAEGVSRRLADLGCDPIAIMAAIAADAEGDPRLRLAAAKELAGYLMTRPRAAGAASAAATSVDVAAIIARGWREPEPAPEPEE
jgi:hypothetical protein